MPSYHVCWNAVLPVAPQFPNQEPPRAQQLSLPDFAMVPHVRHTELMVVIVAANVCIRGIIVSKDRKTLRNPLSTPNSHVSTPVNPGLTFAGLHALKPAIVKFSVASTSTIIIPGTTRSATTDSPGFLESTTFWTCDNGRRDFWRGQ